MVSAGGFKSIPGRYAGLKSEFTVRVIVPAAGHGPERRPRPSESARPPPHWQPGGAAGVTDSELRSASVRLFVPVIPIGRVRLLPLSASWWFE